MITFDDAITRFATTLGERDRRAKRRTGEREIEQAIVAYAKAWKIANGGEPSTPGPLFFNRAIQAYRRTVAVPLTRRAA